MCLRIHHGFHLIELMLSIAILGIILSITIPSYYSYILKSHRLEAEATLIKLAVALEHYHIEQNSYVNANLNSLHFSQYVAHGNYRLVIQYAKESEFMLLAIPQHQQTRDSCGTLTLNSMDAKGANTNDCW